MPNILPTPDAANLVNFSCSVLCLLAQLCPTLCNPMDHSLPGSFVHGDSPGKNTGVGSHAHLQGSSQPKDRTQVSHISGRFFTIWATREALSCSNGYEINTLCHLNSPFPNNQWCCVSFPVPICHCTFSVKCPNLLPIFEGGHCLRTLYTFWMQVQYQIYYVIIPSPSLCCWLVFSHCCFWVFCCCCLLFVSCLFFFFFCLFIFLPLSFKK